jgi:hypothetical protein
LVSEPESQVTTINSEMDLIFDLEHKSSVGLTSLPIGETESCFLNISLGCPQDE